MKRILALIAIIGVGFLGFGAGCNLLHFSLTTIGSNDTFAGELQNNTGANFLGHKFKVAFVDANGNVVDTKTGVDGCLRSWQAGNSDFFSVASTSSASTTTAAIGALDLGSPLGVGTTVSGNATISNVASTRNGATLTITGTLKNSDTVTLTGPAVCAVVYSSGSNVVVTRKAALGDLTTNSSVNFTITVTVPDSTTSVDHFSLWADGLENNIPTNPISVTGQGVVVATATATCTATATSTNTGTPPPTNTATTAPTSTNTVAPTATATGTAPATNTATTAPTNTATPHC